MADIKLRIQLNQNGDETIPEYLDIDKFNGLKSVESLSQSTNEPNSLFYGVIPNSGKIEVVDVDGRIRQYIDNGNIDNSNLPITIYANGKQVMKHISTDSNYQNLTKTFSVDLGDTLSHWDDMQYQGYAYPNKSKTAYQMLVDVFYTIGYTSTSVDRMLTTQIEYGNTFGTVKQYLQSISIPYPYLEPDTFRNTIDKFCRLAQLQVYKDDDGRIKFVSARPIASLNENRNIIEIPINKQYGDLEKSIFLKNKYEAVEIDETKVNDSVKFNQSVNYQRNTINSLQGNKTYDHYVNSGIPGTEDVAYAKIECYYTSGSFNIPYLSNHNLEEIVNIYTQGEPDEGGYYNVDLEYSCNYKKANSTFTNLSQLLTDLGSYVYGDGTFGNTVSYQNVTQGQLGEDITTEIPKNLSFTYRLATASVDLQDKSYVRIKEFKHFTIPEKYINVSYKILTKVRYFSVGRLVLIPPSGNSDTIEYTKIEDYIAQDLSLSFNVDKRVISFDNISASDSNINEVETFASIKGSELLQEGTLFNNTKMSTIIKNNIKNDYQNGIPTGVMKISCSNYDSIYHSRVKDWDEGDILETHDLANFLNTDNNSIYRITGRNFRYSGVPMIDLELQENYIPFYLSFNTGTGLAPNSIIVKTKMPINQLPVPTRAGYLFNGWYIDGQLIDNNTIYNWNTNKTAVANWIPIPAGLYRDGELVMSWQEIKSTYPSAFATSGHISADGQSSYFSSVQGDLVLDDEIEIIDSYSFYNCNDLTSISIPNSVTNIGSYAFYGCTKIIEISIPKDVTILGSNLFEECNSLNVVNLYTVWLTTKITSPEMSMFYNSNPNLIIHVHENLNISTAKTQLGRYWNNNSVDSELETIFDLQ